jgi:hypothetical protein
MPVLIKAYGRHLPTDVAEFSEFWKRYISIA